MPFKLKSLLHQTSYSMEQNKAINALAPFLALSKSATSPRAAADLITRATAAPGTYVFAELLQSKQIQNHAETAPEFKPHLRLLEIFSYGTYQTYLDDAKPHNLPELNGAQLLKLRQLTLLTLSTDSRNLTYESLVKSLSLESVQALEELVISAVYAGLIQAQLNPSRQFVEVSSVAPLRDVSPATVQSLLKTLEAWSSRCTKTLAEIDSEIAAIRAAAAKKSKDRTEWDAKMNKAITAEKSRPSEAGDRGFGHSGMGGRGGLGFGDNRPTNMFSRAGFTRSRGGQRAHPIHSTGPSNKRGSEKLTQGHDEILVDDDESMEVDDPDDEGESLKKRASRRKM